MKTTTFLKFLQYSINARSFIIEEGNAIIAVSIAVVYIVFMTGVIVYHL